MSHRTQGGAKPMSDKPMSAKRTDLLTAPCLWCGYNGPRYWQIGSHSSDCPYFPVGAREAREELLPTILSTLFAQVRRDKAGLVTVTEALREAVEGYGEMYCTECDDTPYHDMETPCEYCESSFRRYEKCRVALAKIEKGRGNAERSIRR